MNRQRIKWLRILIYAYQHEHDWDSDKDAEATREMLSECRALVDYLERRLPPDRPHEPGLASDQFDDIPF